MAENQILTRHVTITRTYIYMPGLHQPAKESYPIASLSESSSYCTPARLYVALLLLLLPVYDGRAREFFSGTGIAVFAYSGLYVLAGARVGIVTGSCGCTASQAFPSTTINLPPCKVFLGDGLVAPVVTVSILECQVSFAKTLMAGIRIGGAGV